MKKPPVFKLDIESSHKLLLSREDLRSGFDIFDKETTAL